MSEKSKYVDMYLSYKNTVNVNEVGKDGTLHLCLIFFLFLKNNHNVCLKSTWV